MENDHDFQLRSESEKNKQKATIDQIKGKCWQKWTIQENIQYLTFLQNNSTLFINQFTRRSSRVFLKLSQSLKRRNSEQCRTHHQKMQAKCKGKVPEIIQLVKNTILKSLKKKAIKNDKTAKARLAYFQLNNKFTKYQNIQGIQKNKDENKLFKVKINQNNIAIKINLSDIQQW